MELKTIKKLTDAWIEVTGAVIRFENPDRSKIATLFQETYALLDQYSKKELVPKEISGLLIEMNEFSWWVSNIEDAPAHILYQEITTLVYALNKYFLTRDYDIKTIESFIKTISK